MCKSTKVLDLFQKPPGILSVSRAGCWVPGFQLIPMHSAKRGHIICCPQGPHFFLKTLLFYECSCFLCSLTLIPYITAHLYRHVLWLYNTKPPAFSAQILRKRVSIYCTENYTSSRVRNDISSSDLYLMVLMF